MSVLRVFCALRPLVMCFCVQENIKVNVDKSLDCVIQQVDRLLQRDKLQSDSSSDDIFLLSSEDPSNSKKGADVCNHHITLNYLHILVSIREPSSLYHESPAPISHPVGCTYTFALTASASMNAENRSQVELPLFLSEHSFLPLSCR